MKAMPPNWPIDKITELTSKNGVNIHSDAVFIAEVGSTAHGMSVNDQDDLDLTIVRIETWPEFVNGPSHKQSQMFRTQPEGERSGPGDLDINVYTLRKYVYLLSSGNPSMLGAAYSPISVEMMSPQPDWEELMLYLSSKSAGKSYLGYMKQQMSRWRGERGQKNVNRPELVEKYGFDTKYAGHIVRLGIQGKQYLEDGYLTLPLSEGDARLVKNIRTGRMSEKSVLALCDSLKKELEGALSVSLLPEAPDVIAMRAWLSQFYLKTYTGKGL